MKSDVITVIMVLGLPWLGACSTDHEGEGDMELIDEPHDLSRDSGLLARDMKSTTSDLARMEDSTLDLKRDDQDSEPDIHVYIEPIVLPASSSVNANHLATADACSSCHATAAGASAMRDEADREVGFYDLWQASMMANSARDPFWRAMVAAEVEATPSLKGAIEDKCMTCHAPMRGEAAAMDDLLTPGDTASLGLDGVNCTTCHQIKPDNLGSPESFDGHFELALNGTLYGPHPQPFANPMRMNSGFTPVEGPHMLESELCATCHTLSTTTYSAEGQPTGHTLAEQMPYIEWQNSEYSQAARTQSCQSCHVPRTSEDGNLIMTRIARRPNESDFTQISERALGRHLFIGGNTLIPQILRDQRADLQPRASDAAFNALLEAVNVQLTQSTARVEVEAISQATETLSFNVLIYSEVGHKFPSGFPSRRAWLKVVVRDTQGEVLFTSGHYNDQGVILNGEVPHALEQVGGPIEPHHDIIDDASMVQIYEAVMEGVDAEPAWRLLRGAHYKKDNRILPRGWSAVFADLDKVKPVGPEEANFAGGQDRVRYELSIPALAHAAVIDVELLYQPLATRFASELFAAGSDLDEVNSFKQYWDRADKTPTTVSSHVANIESK